jgi:TatA/E family protein of Tat protein translocase
VPGAAELVIVLLIVLVFFGASRLPTLARSLGQSKKEFHEALAEDQRVAGPCPFCATKVAEDAKFCPGCGKSAELIVAKKRETTSS